MEGFSARDVQKEEERKRTFESDGEEGGKVVLPQELLLTDALSG